MPTVKDVAKVTGVLKVAYNKVYDLLEDEARINNILGKAEDLLKKVPGGKGEDYID